MILVQNRQKLTIMLSNIYSGGKTTNKSKEVIIMIEGRW